MQVSFASREFAGANNLVVLPHVRLATGSGGEKAPLELWGGPECTVSRVGDVFSDQLRMTGHDNRNEDLDLIADLGRWHDRLPVSPGP